MLKSILDAAEQRLNLMNTVSKFAKDELTAKV
jgi:hypothetical protein